MQKASMLSNYLLRFGVPFRQELSRVMDYQHLDSKNLSDNKNLIFRQILINAYQKSDFYRELYDTYGVNISQIQSTADLHKLPVINREHIRAYRKSILVKKPWMMVKGYTSGTSGTPLVLYRNYTSILKENAYLWAHRISAGHQPGMKAVSLRGDLNATQMECFDPYTNTLYLSSFCLKEENMQWYYEKIARFQPNAIYAYPSSLEILCNILKAAGKYLPIKLVFTSSETLYDFQREKIREVLGAQIFDWYGNAERTIALQEGNRGLYHEPPLYAVNEYNAHDIYTSSLINEAFPLIRYRVDDVVDFVLTEDQQCIITGIQGRKDDFLEFTDGRIIGRMSGTLKGVNHIKYAQFVQDIPSEFRINIVPECAFSEDDKKDLESKVRSKVGDVPFTISIVDENKIIKTKAGKYKLIVNNFVRNKLINSV